MILVVVDTNLLLAGLIAGKRKFIEPLEALIPALPSANGSHRFAQEMRWGLSRKHQSVPG